jgi:hypothetical protein
MRDEFGNEKRPESQRKKHVTFKSTRPLFGRGIKPNSVPKILKWQKYLSELWEKSQDLTQVRSWLLFCLYECPISMERIVGTPLQRVIRLIRSIRWYEPYGSFR